MLENHLRTQLEPVAARFRIWRRTRALTATWAVAAVIGVALMLAERGAAWSHPLVLPIFLGVAVLATLIVWQRTGRWEPDYREIARRIEQQHPDLHALLLTAVEQKPDAATGQLSYLQERVIREAIAAAYKQQWIDAVSSGRMAGLRLAQLAALVLFAWVAWQLRVTSREVADGTIAFAKGVTVTPGDTSIERGSGLVVMARFEGAPPAEATLVLGEDTNTARRVLLARSLKDPVFGGSLTEVTSNLTYHVEFEDKRTRSYRVTVYDHPRLERADARLSFPPYTGLTNKAVPDTRRISAVEGTQMELTLRLNKPVARAELVGKDKTIVPLLSQPHQPTAVLSNYLIAASQTYDLRLVDAEGRTNKLSAQFVIDALKNRTPELKILAPRGDQRVSPIEEVTFQAEAWDDFGLPGYGLAYRTPGKETQFISLGTNAPANHKTRFAHLLSLEKVGVQADDLVTFYVWADDIGPDGNLRRTASDMYFAEVRPFEEVFREAPSMESQGEQQQQQQQSGAEKLAELQKQIINATWKLQRQEAGRTNEPSTQYLKDASVVHQSQEQAVEMAEAMKERVEDPRLQPLAENVVKEMQRAAEQLADARKSPKPLPAALDAEEAAYQALLKMSAREHMVARSRNRSSGGNRGPNQQQLDQLDLAQEENRYETQRQATPQVNPQQQEQLQILNRLKELARRQQDVNERIKELQAALQAAKTEEEREALRRQLKRLREEEQSLLADLDEVRQRMDRATDQASMADARRQLEQTRGEMQRATEAMEREAAQQALAEGTRAQQSLQQTTDELRKKNASQFAEEMRQMRNDARQLAQKQEQAGQKLESLVDSKRKRLSESEETKALTQQLDQQRSGLTNLLSQMRGVSERAENVEPLLSQKLYDTLRQSSQKSTDQSLELARELVNRSFLNEAAPFEQKARQEINQLKEGVERATESVLGDDTEALRRAKRELDELTRQVEQEMAQAEARNARTNGAAGQQSAAANQSRGQTNQPAQQGRPSGAGQQQDQQNQQASATSGNQQTDQNQQQGQAGQQNQQAQNQAGQQGGQSNQQQASQQNQSGQQPGRQQDQQAQSGQGQQGQQGQSQQDPQGQQAQQGQQGQQDQQAQQGQQGQGGQQNQQGQPQNQQANQQGQGNGQGQPQDQPNQQNQQAQPPGQQAQQGQQGQQPGQGGRGQQNPPPEANQQAQNAQQPTDQPGQGGGRTALTPGREPRPLPETVRQKTGHGVGERFFETASDGDPDGGPLGPLTGHEFTQWSDRLRDVEEMIDPADLRNQVAQARDRARAMRQDFKRHGKEPQWPLVRTQIVAPLAEVRLRINEELARRESKDALVPIDRDPVPNRYSELVRRYYEKLGSEK